MNEIRCPGTSWPPGLGTFAVVLDPESHPLELVQCREVIEGIAGWTTLATFTTEIDDVQAEALAVRLNTQRKLLEACKAMLRASECHVFQPQPTDEDSCRLCGKNVRHARHLRVDEGDVREAELRANDEARAAIALAEPEKTP